MEKMLNIKINGMECTVPYGTTTLEAARGLGIEIPTLCYLKEINEIGGKLPDAVGIPEEQLRRAATLAVCKINIDSDIRLAMTAGIRRVLTNQPDVFDPRTYLTVARAEVKKMVAHKIKDVLGSANTL